MARLILDKAHRDEMRKTGTWINIHMTPVDSRIFYLARQMKKEGVFDYVVSTLGALTRVVVHGEGHTITSEAELSKFANKPLSSYEKRDVVPLMDDSGVSMETD